MRKLAFVVLGLLLLAGALSVAHHRHFTGPHVSQGGRGGDYSYRTSGRQGGGSGSRLSALEVFDLIVNVLNVVVGGVGIYLAVAGLRMQRANSGDRRT